MAIPQNIKRTTLAEVASAAGVSVMTASYTYNNPQRVSHRARLRVLAAAEQLGYCGPDPSARSLRRGSTLTVGVVIGEHMAYAFEDPGAVAFLTGVAEVCAGHGYGMTILPTTGGTDDALRVTNAAVDAFIVWTTSEDDPVLTAVQATKRPAVIHGGPALDGLAVVSIENREAALAIGAIAFAGAKRPAVLSQPLSPKRISTIVRAEDLDEMSFPVTRNRLEGFREAATAAGLTWGDVTVAVCGRNEAVEAEVLASTLIASPEPPDTVVAMSDQMAAGVVRAARRADLRVPEDLAITGWEDTPIAQELGLTTVSQSLREQGATCASAALGHSPGTEPQPWSIVRRTSTR